MLFNLSSFFFLVEGDNGSMWFWDWKSGHNFQQSQTIVQPGMHIFCSFMFNLVLVTSTIYTKLASIIVMIFPLTGSLDSEAGIYALTYDNTGTRLISCEADKTIKMWKEDDTATPETHPLNFRPPKDMRRF